MTFAPGVLERLDRRLPCVRVTSRGTPRVDLLGFRLSFHAGEHLRGLRLPSAIPVPGA